MAQPIEASQPPSPDAETTITQPAPALALLLLAGPPLLTEMLSALCAGLGIDLVLIASVPTLPAGLHGVRPIGFACSLEGTGATAACHAVKAVARYDIGLPILMVTDDDPETLGCLDAIASLCGVTELTRLTAPPRAEDLMAFVARAGRRSGRLRLLPV